MNSFLATQNVPSVPVTGEATKAEAREDANQVGLSSASDFLAKTSDRALAVAADIDSTEGIGSRASGGVPWSRERATVDPWAGTTRWEPSGGYASPPIMAEKIPRLRTVPTPKP